MMSKRSWIIVLVMGWFICGFASLSHAQETDPLESAKRAYLEGRFEDSVRDLQPLVETLKESESLRDAHFFLGLNYLALGRDADAEGHFGSAVRRDPAFVPSESLYSPNIVAAYQDIRNGLVGSLRVVSQPQGARVLVAGKELGRTPIESTLLTGEYMVRTELDGHTPAERAVRVQAGEEARVDVSLRALAEPEPAETPAEESEPAQTSTQTSPSSGGISGKTIGIIAGVGGGAAVALAAAAGGSDSGTSSGGSNTPSTPPSSSQASINASIAPNPINASASGDPAFPWSIDFEVTVRESAGVGGNIDFINTTIRDLETGRESPALNYGADTIVSRAGTNHVNGQGSLTVPLGLRYRLGGGGRAAVLIAEIRFSDDRGNVLTTVAQTNIQ